MATPTENGVTLDQFNDALRQSPGWQNFMRRNGIPLDGSPIQLSGSQREALRQELARAGVQFPDGMQIDPAGNVNQDQGVSRAWNTPWIKWPVIAGGALATMGALGYGPLAGVLGGGGGGGTLSGIAAGTLPGGGAAPMVTVGGASAAAPSFAGAAIPGIAAGTLPGGAAAPVVSPGLAAGAAGGAGAAPSVLQRLKGMVPDSLGDVAKLAAGGAALIPSFTGSGDNNAFGNAEIEDEVKRALALQRGRVEQAQPVYDALVNMAYGMTPTRYRGAQPAGYPAAAQQAPAGPYAYKGPRFN